MSPVATVTSRPAQLSETVPAASPMMPAGAQGHVESAAARAEPAGGAPPTVPREAEAVLRQLVGPITTLVSSGGRTSGSVTIALHPAELGRVELRVERRADGRLQIGLSAERADTLVLLRSDQAALDRALTQAGLPPEGRSISFDLAGQGGSSTHSQFQADAEARGGRAGRAPERQDPEAAADTSTYTAPPPARHGAHQSRLDISI